MPSVNTVSQSNAQALAQIQRLAEVAANGQQATVDHAVKLAKLSAQQGVEAVSASAKEAALDTVV